MEYNFNDRVLALAGIYQAATLVQQVAKTARADQDDVETLLKALLNTSPSSVTDVYGAISNLKTGLNSLHINLGNKHDEKNLEIIKYVIGIMVLEKKLGKHPSLLNDIGKGIDRAKVQTEHFPITHENVIANLASIYTETISTLQPRIMVNGESEILSSNEHANKIRALLLSAIRSAVLWRQCGGSRWDMLFKRKKILETTEHLINQ